VKGEVEELYDYDALRALPEATMFVVRPSAPTVVLGGSQSLEVLSPVGPTSGLRRRRGGGGLVLLQPEDVWIDWWIPSSDERWSADVHVMSRRVGGWWGEVLASRLERDVVVHQGGLSGEATYRVACFAGRGPGEVFVDDRKVVGVTQWRVREGVFVSTVLHAHSSAPLLRMLRDVPEGLGEALNHHVVTSLGLDAEELTTALIERCEPIAVRHLFLIA
jgi:lipoate-protein ligase A